MYFSNDICCFNECLCNSGGFYVGRFGIWDERYQHEGRVSDWLVVYNCNDIYYGGFDSSMERHHASNITRNVFTNI